MKTMRCVVPLLIPLCLTQPALALEARAERMIGPGVKCITLTRDQGPWVIRVIEADGESGYVRAGATFASARGLQAARVSAQALQATTETRYPIAGINGDFFVKSPGPFEADPIGALVIGGEVISSPYPRSALLIGADGCFAIRRLRLAAWVQKADGARAELRGVNQARNANDLILYTPRFGSSTGTNIQGSEAALTGIELPLRLGQTYRAQVADAGDRGDSPIPTDGVVLSGHGSAREFIRALKPGEELQLRLEFDPPVAPDTDVIGGGPTLLRDSRVVVATDTEGFRSDVVGGRAPRTAVGFNGRRLLLVTVDGRRPGVSVGMTLAEMAELMRELGCTDALNLDGGGSTTTWVRGSVLNIPSDGAERRVANALFLFSTAPKGPPVHLTIAPEEIALLAGATCPLVVTGAEDEFYNPVPAPVEAVTWRVEPNVGAVDAGGRLTIPSALARRSGREVKSVSASLGSNTIVPLTTIAGVVRAEAGKASGSARLRVYAHPPRLEVNPAQAVLPPGALQPFTVRPLDELGRPLLADGVPVRWSCPPELGQVSDTGVFQAAPAPARGELTVEIAGTRRVIPITVGAPTGPLEGFETARWTATTFPATVKGTVTNVEGMAREGRRSLKLEYDFTGEKATRAVYAVGSLPLGQPAALRLWVRGDGGGGWLRARLRDPAGHAHVIDFSRDLGHLDDWCELKASLPANLTGPLTLEALYLAEPDPLAQTKGAILIDSLTVDPAPLPSAPTAVRVPRATPMMR
jgi:hypothetical protein